MGLPNTLSGMAAFIIFIVFVVAITVPNTATNSDSINTAQTQFLNSLNQSVNSSSIGTSCGIFCFVGQVTGLAGVYDFIVGMFQILLGFFNLTGLYLYVFGVTFASVPPVFFVIFAIFASGLIVGVIKLIFLNGD